jgi:hypothetical protein
VANPLERLDTAYAEVLDATDEVFFRRLRDYARLLENDRKIRKAVKALKKDVADADAEFKAKDAAFVTELVALRNRLIEREPNADDTEATRPARDPMDPAGSARFHAWIWTLANFDAVAAEGEDRIVERDGLDDSSSRMLGAILNAKLYDLVVPFNDKPAPRPDLRDVYDEMNSIRHRETAAHRQLEEVSEETGYLALLRIQHVVSHLGPRPERSTVTPEEKREFLETALLESMGGFAYLREAMRPKEARGSLDQKAREALERHERECRKELERLHRPLRKRLDKRRWPGLTGRIKWVPPVIGFVVDTVTLLIFVAAAVGGLKAIGVF